MLVVLKKAETIEEQQRCQWTTTIDVSRSRIDEFIDKNDRIHLSMLTRDNKYIR
jgi:hypothetical protein